jgi:intracellular multiplication protein IcmL
MMIKFIKTLFSRQQDLPEQGESSALPAVTLVSHRYEFYRDQYCLLLRIVFVESFILASVLGLVMILLLRPVSERFFATTPDGKLISLSPLDEPNLETSAVLSWANRAVMETFTFGFHDRRLRHQAIRKYFTAEGWESFQKALEEARVIEMVEKQHLVVSAIPESTPVIVEEGLFAGRYYWIVQVPMVVTYQGATKTSSTPLTLKVRVERTSVLNEGEGLGITQWVASQGI